MKHLTLTALLAATLGLTPVAPAQAQMTNEQINQLLLGIAAIGAVGITVDKLKDRKDDKKKKEKAKKAKHKRDVGTDRTPHRQILPARCENVVEGRNGNIRRVLGKRCVEQSTRVRRLPQRCEREVYAFGRYRDVYGKRCLEKFGWTVARHQ
jgi:hypothetical protein